MSPIVILVFAVVMRVLMAFVKRTLWFEVIRYLAAGLPLIMIMLDVLDGDEFSIVFAGICFFYFPFVKSKMPEHNNAS